MTEETLRVLVIVLLCSPVAIAAVVAAAGTLRRLDALTAAVTDLRAAVDRATQEHERMVHEFRLNERLRAIALATGAELSVNDMSPPKAS